MTTFCFRIPADYISIYLVLHKNVLSYKKTHFFFVLASYASQNNDKEWVVTRARGRNLLMVAVRWSREVR